MAPPLQHKQRIFYNDGEGRDEGPELFRHKVAIIFVEELL